MLHLLLFAKVNGVVGWYPHLIFPEEATWHPPDFDHINCPILLLYGSDDDKIEPGTVALAASIAHALDSYDARATHHLMKHPLRPPSALTS